MKGREQHQLGGQRKAMPRSTLRAQERHLGLPGLPAPADTGSGLGSERLAWAPDTPSGRKGRNIRGALLSHTLTGGAGASEHQDTRVRLRPDRKETSAVSPSQPSLSTPRSMTPHGCPTPALWAPCPHLPAPASPCPESPSFLSRSGPNPQRP